MTAPATGSICGSRAIASSRAERIPAGGVTGLSEAPSSAATSESSSSPVPSAPAAPVGILSALHTGGTVDGVLVSVVAVRHDCTPALVATVSFRL